MIADTQIGPSVSQPESPTPKIVQGFGGWWKDVSNDFFRQLAVVVRHP